MSIDTTTPRSRRAILAGAIGGVLASVGLMSKPETVRAGSDGDVVLDASNVGTGTTEILAVGSNPAFRAIGGGVGIQAAGGIGVDAAGDPAVSGLSTAAGLVGIVGWSQGQGTGVIGWSTNGTASSPTPPAKTGLYGESTVDAASRGVYGRTTSGQGVRGEATSGVGVQGVASGGAALRGDAATGFALDATSTGGNAVRGTGGLDGVIGQSAGNHAGVVGFSGGTAPAGPANTGVFGEANQDATARGVLGKSTLGQAVRGETTTGVGVQAVATTGVALAATGKVTMNRSGKVTVPINVTSIDVTVPGGLTGSPLAFATLQYSRTGVWVTGARPNWPSTGKLRIYLNKGLATATPVAWMVIG